MTESYNNIKNAQVRQAYPNGTTLFQRVSGALGATLFSGVYVVAPLWVIFAMVLTLFRPACYCTWLVVAPLVISAVLPVCGSVTLLQSWPLKYLPAYFDYTEINETSTEEVKELMATRRVMFCCQPHGVFTFGGACAGVVWSKLFWNPNTCPTAVAASVIGFPLIKHVVGLFGLCDASSKVLKRTLGSQGKSCVIYPGGIAELFLTDHLQEKLYVHKRKGFVKVAMQAGVEILPVYFLGNTTVMKLAKSPSLRAFARATGVTVSWFWGVWGTPIPYPRKVISVIGRPLGLPHIPEPTDQQVEEYHAKYLDEVRRLFDTYKVYHPDFAKKTLHFE